MTISFNQTVSEIADAFAEREYESNGYEREWLSKGYYHGYMDAVRQFNISLGHPDPVGDKGPEGKIDHPSFEESQGEKH